MRTGLLLPVLVIATLFQPLLPRVARGQTVRTRILSGVEVTRAPGSWELRIRFTTPVRYLLHSPRSQGDLLRIQVELLQVGAADLPSAFGRESLLIPPDMPIPLEEVSYEGEPERVSFVDLRFATPVLFDVRRGRDLRSVVVSVRPVLEGARRAPSRTVLPEPPPAQGGPADLVEEGRRAMTAGELDRAIQVFTHVLSLPEQGDATAAAKELLGLARERKGQLAHAKAEYEEYLARWPEGPGADRVRQRLEALVTARSEPAEPLRRTTEEEDGFRRRLDYRGFGSLYVAYRRASEFTDAEGETLADSSLITDLHASSRLRAETWTLRHELSAGYRYDFVQGGTADEMRVSSLFLDAESIRWGLSGSVGRRSSSSGGVLGRYDGARIGVRLPGGLEFGAVGGFPVDSPTVNRIDTDRSFVGVSLDGSALGESLQGQVFAIGQRASGLVDRVAVGGELRWFDDGRFLASFLDYDVYYRSLNTAQLVGNWQIDPATFLHFLADHRNVPTLTTTNALQGQGAGDLDDLDGIFSTEELESLAEDRTARSTTLSLGASRDLTERYQLAGDFSASHLSGTPTSGGVEGFEGTGWEYSYLMQLVATGFIRKDDIGILGVRYFDGSATDLVSTSLDLRWPVNEAVRVNPGLRAEFRMNDAADDLVTVRPSFRIDVRFWKLLFELDGIAEWRRPVGGSMPDEFGYAATASLRYDF
jgi:hypothetical protein